MSTIVIGGILPAFFIGIAMVLLKLSGQMGVSAATNMMILSVGVFVAGLIGSFFGLGGGFSWGGGGVSVLTGIFWATGTLCISYAVNRFGLPMSLAASLAATNALVAVVLSLIFFKEGTDLNIIKLLLGVLCIVAGSILVTIA